MISSHVAMRIGGLSSAIIFQIKLQSFLSPDRIIDTYRAFFYVARPSCDTYSLLPCGLPCACLRIFLVAPGARTEMYYSQGFI